jgi:hypothetical protein
VLANAAASLIEVTNAVPQPSHDQAWSIRPRRLNRDASAISSTLPQSGHFGRRKSPVATTRLDAFWHAVWSIIADASSTFAHRTHRQESPSMLKVAYGAAATPS